MEKYYIVTDQSKLRQEYLTYWENAEKINELVDEFMKRNNIKTNEYYATNECIYIVPTKEDEEAHSKALAKEFTQGLRAFKKNSKEGKDWINSLSQMNLKVLYKPSAVFYFKYIGGNSSSRLFHVEDTVYCSFSVRGSFENPPGFIELKASEFFKVIEDHNEKMKNN